MRRRSATWLELILIVVLVISTFILWGKANQIVDAKLHDKEMPKELLNSNAEIVTAKEEFARIKDERIEVRKKWTKENLIFLEKDLRIEQLELQYPNLKSNNSEEIPQNVQVSYQEIKAEQVFRKVLLKRLKERLDSLPELEEEKRLAITKAQGKSLKLEKESKDELQQLKLRNAFTYTSLMTLALLLVASAEIWLIDRVKKLVRVWLLWCSTLAALIVIFLPQLFAPASLIISVLILIPILIVITPGKVT